MTERVCANCVMRPATTWRRIKGWSGKVRDMKVCDVCSKSMKDVDGVAKLGTDALAQIGPGPLGDEAVSHRHPTADEQIPGEAEE